MAVPGEPLALAAPQPELDLIRAAFRAATVDYDAAVAACPTPEYHATHRYCPSCPWTEADDAGPCPATCLVGDDRCSVTRRCDDYEGHPGDHHAAMDACQPVARLVWGDVT